MRPPYEATPAHGSDRVFAALDLGTNNCRLLIAAPKQGVDYTDAHKGPAIKILDSFSRIVRLGEGVSVTENLSEAAMQRTRSALIACQKKLSRYPLARTRFVATEACRRAKNGPEFLDSIYSETGLKIDIITSEEEAHLAFMGCASLLTQHSNRAMVFDIGGGSTELLWIDIARSSGDMHSITDWLSMGYGVMNLADKFGGTALSDLTFSDMVRFIRDKITVFDNKNHISKTISETNVQLLSTSGTVTTLAAIHLDLPRYDRARIDGITLPITALRDTIKRLLKMRPSERFNHPCIGPDRADYILSGCAIFEAISSLWPEGDIAIADRGVREGIILSLMRAQM